MIYRDGCSSAVHPDNFISTSVSHNRTASGCRNSSGIYLAAVMPKIFKELNNSLLAFLKLSHGFLLRIRDYSKYLEQILPNTLTDHSLKNVKDLHIHFSYSVVKLQTVKLLQPVVASVVCGVH